MDFSGRVKKLQGLLGKGLGAFMVTDPEDILYYTGYRISSDFSFLIVSGKGSPLLAVSSLENEAENLKWPEVLFIRSLKDFLKPLKSKVLGYDEYEMSAYLFSRLRRKIRMKPAAGLIKEPRMVKGPGEIEKIKRAIGITRGVLGSLDFYGKSELEVARGIDMAFGKRGADNAFETHVASGVNSSSVHHLPGSRAIRKGDMVVVDAGARYDSYCSDMSRSFYPESGKRERKVYEDVLEMQGLIMDGIRSGVRFEDVQKIYEELMKRKGYEVLHSFGHGVGLGVHERPGRGDLLKENMVLTVEPGVYIRNFGGCRIEDMILVRKNGVKVLSK